jgi:hypothetical protein
MLSRSILILCPLLACLMTGCADSGPPAATEPTDKVATPVKLSSGKAKKAKKPDRASAPKIDLRATTRVD